MHLGGNLAEAARQVLGVGRVIPRHEGAMQIGSAQNGDIYRFSGHGRGTQAKQQGKQRLFHHVVSL
ncbi:hypothetical protein D3C75_1255210 [compost metagenome]